LVGFISQALGAIFVQPAHSASAIFLLFLFFFLCCGLFLRS
jgi:hypothetical protein